MCRDGSCRGTQDQQDIQTPHWYQPPSGYPPSPSIPSTPNSASSMSSVQQRAPDHTPLPSYGQVSPAEAANIIGLLKNKRWVWFHPRRCASCVIYPWCLTILHIVCLVGFYLLKICFPILFYAAFFLVNWKSNWCLLIFWTTAGKLERSQVIEFDNKCFSFRFAQVGPLSMTFLPALCDSSLRWVEQTCLRI